MNARRWILICAMLGASAAAYGSEVNGIGLAHYEPLRQLGVSAGDTGYVQKVQGVRPINMTFEGFGRSFELALEANAGLLAAMSKGGIGGGVVPYRGRIAGVPGSWARIVMTDGMPAGLVWDGADLYAIEAPGDSIVDTAIPIMYRLADAIIAPGALSCAGAAHVTDGKSTFTAVVAKLGSVIAQGPGAVSEIDIGAVGDFEFTSAKGSNAASAIVTRLNNVDGIYSAQLGIQINVPIVDTFTDSNDPFSATTDPGTLLNELGTYRAGTPSQSSNGLTHLFTGRDLDGSTVGIAYTSALCSVGFGAGLSEGNGSATFDSLVAAHEIGHNFGAPHDAIAGSPCESTPPDFLMATSLNGSDQFSACSITEMQDDIAAAACITPLPSTDISIEYNDAPPTILLSNAATVTFDVVNNGTQTATNVVADITLPGIVSFLTASSAGNCTNGAGSVTCQLGDVAGSSATTVTVSADTIAIGAGAFDATVTADVDDNAGNNQTSALLTVDPAVNLVVSAPASATITINQSTTVTTTLENLSTLGATGVTLSVTLDAGLQANTATWSIGTCNVTAQQIDCAASQFAPQSSSSLSIGVTGLTRGNRSYTVALASVEADADPSDNSVNGSVRVNAESSGDSGGGGLGAVLLAILGAAACRRKLNRQNAGG